jgi:diacylglycerol kinase (ATP)
LPHNAVRSAVLVGHSTARHAAADFERARHMLTEHGVDVREAYLVESDKRLRKMVRRAIKRRPDVVVVAGGDGTMTKVVGEFAGREAVLGVLPLGTGNSFAQSLGIGSDLERAVETIARGKIAAVDLGRIDGDYFANFATLGFASDVARSASPILKRIIGTLAYVLAGIVPFVRARPFDCKIKADGHTVEFETYQVIVASGRYFGSATVAPEAGLESGKLALFATSDASRLDIVETYVALLTNRQTLLPNAHVFEAESIKIRTRPRQLISVDGSPFGKTPVRFGVAPKALRVLVSGPPPGPQASP